MSDTKLSCPRAAPFGCLVWFLDLWTPGRKFDAKAIPGIMLAYGKNGTLGMLLFLLASLATVLWHEGSLATLRIASTRQPPELTLPAGGKYHLFLSHIWSTGQDATATIKRQLQRLLPEARIFLDVDDLQDIGSLERYVDESAVVLMFLSKGYFSSRNCLREVVSTLEKRKRIVLVHEADPSKGGQPLEDQKLELANAAHRAAVFEPERRVTTWFRIADFQHVSLVEIAEATLLGLPGYADVSTLPLVLPGSLAATKLVFQKKVVLYASKRNPGAQAAAKEMKSAYQREVGVVSEAAWDDWQRHGRSGRLWASTARGLGGGIAEASSDRASSSQSAKQASEPTHFLLYLNHKTFVGADGEKLAEEVRRARRDKKLPVILVHENDEADGRDGCEFARFFGTTPSDLIDGGLYGTIAVAFMPGHAHRRVSYALCAKALGAGKESKGRLGRLGARVRRSSVSEQAHGR